MFPPIQATGLKYFSWRKIPINKLLQRYFYTSYEDALWDLLKFWKVSKNAIVLAPEFFCEDVVKNMANHGLKTVFYPMDQNFQTSDEVFIKYLNKYQPQIVIIFHAVGIKNRLIDRVKIWHKFLPYDTHLIEDSVHSLIDPQSLNLINDRHVVIDSLRKTSPLMGSQLFTTQNIQLKTTPGWKTLNYQLRVFYRYLIFQSCLNLAALRLNFSWNKFWNLQAESWMLHGYDLIGDSHLAGAGWPVFSFLAQHPDLDKIKKIKSTQVKIYQQQLQFLKNNSSVADFALIDFSSADAPNLRGFPLVININRAKKILQFFRQHGFITRFELTESIWSQNQKIIYLPLGPHVQTQEIKNICALIRAASALQSPKI